MNRNLYLLAACQGLFLTNNVVFIAINGLIGLSLAPVGWMATLPVMGYVVGGALSTPLVARSQEAWGRKGSFMMGLAVGLFSALLCAWAVWHHQFWLLVAGTVIAGYYSANGQLYRFAAAELAAPAYREKAISLVLAGGLIGAVIGPNLATRTRGAPPSPVPVTRSSRPSPFTSPTATVMPPVNDGSYTKKSAAVSPVFPSTTRTRGPPPVPGAITTSRTPSPVTSPRATRTPPRNESS